MSATTSRDTATPSIDLIQGFLEKYGWTYELIDPITIVTGFSTGENIFTMFIRCNDEIVYISIPNFVKQPDEQCTLNTYKYLLQANLNLVCGKFALDESKKIGLFAEFPVSVMSYDFFSFMLYSFGINADEQVNYVSDVSQNPQFKSPYEQLKSK